MNYEQYLKEGKSGKVNFILTNMVAISRSNAELDNMEDIVNKALLRGMIHPKEATRLKREIVDLRKSVTK